MDNTKRFDNMGELYEKARPKYAEKLLDYMKNTLNLNRGVKIADIGSGTGIFTEQLLKKGCFVYAVEPNADMRKKAEAKLSYSENFRSVAGSAQDTCLSNESVDYITCAQAFHWFDADDFKKECKRILKPGGKVIIVYNLRDESAECTKALFKLRRKYNPDFKGFSNGISDEAIRKFFDNKCEVFKCENNFTYDRQSYVNRVLSSSYSLKENDDKYDEYLKDINYIFDSFSADGKITVPNFTAAYIG